MTRITLKLLAAQGSEILIPITSQTSLFDNTNESTPYPSGKPQLKIISGLQRDMFYP